jgi:tetratricopeptide (TPR) repeat protein
MRRILLASGLIIIFFAGFLVLFQITLKTCQLKQRQNEVTGYKHDDANIAGALKLLRIRKDSEALAIFEKTLSKDKGNITALWGKAEVLRRTRSYKESEQILSQILEKNPKHIPSLISLAYIKYKDDNLNEALKLVNQALKNDNIDKENRALAYMMLGTINSRRSAKGWFLNKLRYGTQIRCHFLKAKEFAPDLPEVHLGLGTFYLLAPPIVGGNLNGALKELELAVKIAPDFATANARLAQAYKRKGDLEKYKYYFQRAKELDPDNEVLMELVHEK